MRKEEILEMSRNNMEDEGEIFVENKSRQYGVTAFTTMFLVVSVFNYMNGIDNIVAKILFSAYLSAESFGRYKTGSGKLFLLGTIVSGIASVFGFIYYALVSIGVWG